MFILYQSASYSSYCEVKRPYSSTLTTRILLPRTAYANVRGRRCFCRRSFGFGRVCCFWHSGKSSGRLHLAYRSISRYNRDGFWLLLRRFPGLVSYCALKSIQCISVGWRPNIVAWCMFVFLLIACSSEFGARSRIMRELCRLLSVGSMMVADMLGRGHDVCGLRDVD